MSDEWIDPRLADALGRQQADDIAEAGYERWLLVVDESGQVTSITRLDKNANSIGSVTP